MDRNLNGGLVGTFSANRAAIVRRDLSKTGSVEQNGTVPAEKLTKDLRGELSTSSFGEKRW